MTLFGITYINKQGLRTLFGPAQGRAMCETRESAESLLADFRLLSERRMIEVCGEQASGTFRVDAFDCYAHGDPKGIYVDDEPSKSDPCEDLREIPGVGGPCRLCGIEHWCSEP